MIDQIDLAAELRRAQREFYDRAPTNLIVSQDARIWGWIGIERVIIDELGMYRPDPRGLRAFVTPVRVGNPMVSAWEVVRFGNIVDLVCWHPKSPMRWVLRTGEGSVLGHPEVGTQQRIMPNVLAWLRTSGSGLAFLQPIPIGVAA